MLESILMKLGVLRFLGANSQNNHLGMVYLELKPKVYFINPSLGKNELLITLI